jgi:hypothetical protein
LYSPFQLVLALKFYESSIGEVANSLISNAGPPVVPVVAAAFITVSDLLLVVPAE